MRHDPAAAAVTIMLRSLKMHGMAQAAADPSRKETTAHLTGSKNPASPKPGSNLRGKPGSALGGIQQLAGSAVTSFGLPHEW